MLCVAIVLFLVPVTGLFYSPFNCNVAVPMDCMNLPCDHIEVLHAESTNVIVYFERDCCSTFSSLHFFKSIYKSFIQSRVISQKHV